ncbi:agmatine deiminase family protein [Fimbriiglobus ruber]|uniref:Agmatine deiminase n=1 Tax=Fimbriiglobus ruber TaxID=1908690 RepID=A0A225D6H9_9BACT|nr:agmatine deiminase family protein [Fimbriiglobus ruber]OWK34128.1 Agmatine deiminase [Fimbriiglobus ruber]
MIPDWEANGVFLADLFRVRHPALFEQLHSILVSHGVEVRLLDHVQDLWARDYSPIQIGPGEFVQFRYAPDYLEGHPELRTGREVAGQFHELGECRHSEINLDGGNVVTSRTKAIVTDKIYRENPNWERDKLRDELCRTLQVEELIVIPKEPYEPIGHADAMIRFLSEEAVIVNEYAEVDPAFGNRLVKVLCRHGLTIEYLPYYPEKKTLAGIPSAVGNYTNFLRTKKVLVAPVYGTHHDEIALRKLASVFPDLPILPLDCTELAREGGILNCVSASFRISTKTSRL